MRLGDSPEEVFWKMKRKIRTATMFDREQPRAFDEGSKKTGQFQDWQVKKLPKRCVQALPHQKGKMQPRKITTVEGFRRAVKMITCGTSRLQPDITQGDEKA